MLEGVAARAGSNLETPEVQTHLVTKEGILSSEEGTARGPCPGSLPEPAGTLDALLLF